MAIAGMVEPMLAIADPKAARSKLLHLSGLAWSRMADGVGEEATRMAITTPTA